MPNFSPSVIIPAYNSSEFIVMTLNSVSNQTLRPREVIIVDDGSTDNTIEVIHKWSEYNNLNIRILRKENGGAASARNFGIREALSDWVCFLDSDDLYDPDALNNFSWALNVFPDAEWLGGDLMSVSEDLQNTEIASFSDRLRVAQYLSLAFASGQPIRMKRPWREFLDVCMTGMGAVAVRRDLLLRNGGFREDLRIAEDYQLWIRLAREADFIFLPRRMCRYRTRAGSLMNSGFPPRFWTKKAFQQLVSDYGFDPEEETFLSRTRSFELEDSYYYSIRGEFIKAMQCCWRGIRHDKWSLSALNTLLRTAVRSIRSNVKVNT